MAGPRDCRGASGHVRPPAECAPRAGSSASGGARDIGPPTGQSPGVRVVLSGRCPVNGAGLDPLAMNWRAFRCVRFPCRMQKPCGSVCFTISSTSAGGRSGKGSECPLCDRGPNPLPPGDHGCRLQLLHGGARPEPWRPDGFHVLSSRTGPRRFSATDVPRCRSGPRRQFRGAADGGRTARCRSWEVPWRVVSRLRLGCCPGTTHHSGGVQG